MDEKARILAALAAAPFPDYVVDRRVLLDRDWGGEDSVWVYVILADDAPDVRSDEIFELRNVVRRALKDGGIDLWPYIRVRLASEQAELDREQARG